MSPNKNLKRHAECCKTLDQRLAQRLKPEMIRNLKRMRKGLWWKYPAYRKAKPTTNVSGHDILKGLDESEGKTIGIDGQPAVAGRFISHGEQQKLHELISQEKPKVAVEIGLANGYSTVSLLQGLSDKKCGTLISIDPFQLVDFRGAGLMNIRRAGLDGFHFWWGKSSLVALPALLESESKIDFAFIDGNHLFDYTLIEFAYLDKILRKDGLLVFHDYNYPSVRSCLNYIEKNYAYAVAEGREGSLRILRKQEDDQRPWYFFKPFDVPQIEWTTLENRQFCE